MIWDLCPRPVGPGNTSKITEGPVLKSFSYVKQSWYFPLVRKSCWLKTGFFRHIRELKIQRKNLGDALLAIYLCHMNALTCAKRKENQKVGIDFPSHLATKLLYQKSISFRNFNILIWWMGVIFSSNWRPFVIFLFHGLKVIIFFWSLILPLGNFGRTQSKKVFLLCKKGWIKTKWRGIITSKSLFPQQMRNSNMQTIDVSTCIACCTQVHSIWRGGGGGGEVWGGANECLCGLWEHDLLLLPAVGALLK